MDKSKIRIKRILYNIPEKSDLLFPSIKKDVWSSGKLNISLRDQLEKPQIKNYFLQNSPNTPDSPTAKPLNKTPKPFRTKNDYRQQEIDKLEKLLDGQEILYHSLNEFSLKNIEYLFYSYSSYLEKIIQIIALQSHVYKTALTRAKNGFIEVFRKIMAKLNVINSTQCEKSSQTFMSINPGRTSMILSKLGDILNQEMSSSDTLESIIQKTFIDSKRNSKISNSGTQTDYKVNKDGVIEYEFKSYETLQRELDFLYNQNQILIQEKKIITEDHKDIGNIDELINRNKVLEAMVFEMRTKALSRDF
jgi:hypothetical protein